MGRVRGEGGESEAGKGWEREMRGVGGGRKKPEEEGDRQTGRQTVTDKMNQERLRRMWSPRAV